MTLWIFAILLIVGVIALALTMYGDEEFYLALLGAGASGYVLNDAEPEELLSAINAVREGHILPSPRQPGLL